MRLILSTTFFAASLAASSAASSLASTQSSNDGVWAVTMNTQQGECDRTVSSTIQVRNGHVDENGLFARISGSVDDAGKVTLQVARGSDSISARGTVTGQQGQVSWSSPTRNCFGNWTAMRG